MGISLREAASLAGVSRQALQQHIKSGKLSAKRGNKGEYDIEVAELERLYTLRNPLAADGQEVDAALQHEIEMLRLASDSKEQQIRLLQRENDDLRKDKEYLQAHAQTLAITYQHDIVERQKKNRDAGKLMVARYEIILSALVVLLMGLLLWKAV